MENFKKLLQSKAQSQKPMGGLEKDAKLRAVHEMRKMASDEMALPLKGLKKVSVASNSPEGLKEGLDKAEEIVEGGMPKMEEKEVSEEDYDPMTNWDADLSQYSAEELQAKIEELQAALKMKM